MPDDDKIEGTEGCSEISDLIPESKGDSGFLRKCFLLLGGLVLIILGLLHLHRSTVDLKHQHFQVY